MRRPSDVVMSNGSGARRSLAPELFDLDDLEPELRLHRALDRLRPRTGELEVRGVAATRVRHGERIGRREPAERDRRHREAEQHRVERCGG